MYDEYLTAEYLKMKYGIGFRELTGAVARGDIKRCHTDKHDGVETYTFHYGDVMEYLASKRRNRSERLGNDLLELVEEFKRFGGAS